MPTRQSLQNEGNAKQNVEQDNVPFNIPDNVAIYLGHIPYDNIMSVFNNGLADFLSFMEDNNSNTSPDDLRDQFEKRFIELLGHYNALNIRSDIGLILAGRGIELIDDEVTIARNNPDNFLGTLKEPKLEDNDDGYEDTTGHKITDEEYVRLKFEFIKYLMRKYRLNMQDAEDICHDVFIKALTRMPDKVRKRPWLNSVLENAARDAYRKRRNRRTYPFSDITSMAEDGGINLESLFQEGFEDELIDRLSVNPEIYAAYLTLSPEQKKIFYLIFIEEHSIEEAAAILGKSYAAVNVGLSRVRKNMIKELTRDRD